MQEFVAKLEAMSEEDREEYRTYLLVKRRQPGANIEDIDRRLGLIP